MTPLSPFESLSETEEVEIIIVLVFYNVTKGTRNLNTKVNAFPKAPTGLGMARAGRRRDIHSRRRIMPSSDPCWTDLCRREPDLEQLESDVLRIAAGPIPDGFCANRVWYGYDARLNDCPKARLLCLVGWDASRDDPVLHSSRAYNVAYEHLYELLPDCRHEGGICV
jgi:hypothetical protein